MREVLVRCGDLFDVWTEFLITVWNRKDIDPITHRLADCWEINCYI
jgi:hypothetical protein